MAKLAPTSAREKLIITLLLSSGVSLLLLMIRMVATGSTRFWFLVWNLSLAWIPLWLVSILRDQIKQRRWDSWLPLLLSALWLAFLPNSFYIISDFIHLQSSGEVSLLYDVALLTSFVLNGLLLGYISLYIMHRLLLSKLADRYAHLIVVTIILGCSFAIYLGRYLRWNSWDVIISPAGLLFDISDRFVNPGSHFETFMVTFVFFILLTSVYAVIYQIIDIIGSSYSKKP